MIDELRMALDPQTYWFRLHKASIVSATGLIACFIGFLVLDHISVAQESRPMTIRLQFPFFTFIF